MKLFFSILFASTLACLADNSTNIAKLDFSLPRAAKYSVTVEQFEAAKAIMVKNFHPDTNQLSEIIPLPSMCGPGLWNLLKDSPHFSTPPRAKTTCKVPLANGKYKEYPAALIQTKLEAVNFCGALSDLLVKNGDMKFRLPTEKEFKSYWAVIPFDDITEPLIVAEGSNCNVIVLFSKGKPFWFDEVKKMSIN